MAYGGVLGGLNSFAGGLAQGWDRQTQRDMENRRVQIMEAEEARNADKDKRETELLNELRQAGGDQYVFTGSSFEGMSPYTPPPAAGAVTPDQAASTAIGIPSGAPVPVQRAPAPAAPAALPPVAAATPPARAPQAALPPQAASAPQEQTALRVVRDPITGAQYQVDASMTRPRNPLEVARDQYAIYARHGRADEGAAAIARAAQAQVAMANIDKQQMSDELSRAALNPGAFASTAQNLFNKLGVGVDVRAVQVPTGGGKSVPVLQYNMRGTNAPPFYIDRNGQMSQEPDPGAYNANTQMIQGMVRGDTAAALTDIVGTQAKIQTVAAMRQEADQSRQLFPYRLQGAALQPELIRSNIEQSRASANAANANAAATRQQAEYNYGAGAGKGPLGSPRDQRAAQAARSSVEKLISQANRYAGAQAEPGTPEYKAAFGRQLAETLSQQPAEVQQMYATMMGARPARLPPPASAGAR